MRSTVNSKEIIYLQIYCENWCLIFLFTFCLNCWSMIFCIVKFIWFCCNIFRDYHEMLRILLLHKTANNCFFFFGKSVFMKKKQLPYALKVDSGYDNCKHFKIWKKWLFFITSSVFHENEINWEDEIKWIKQTWKSSNLKELVLAEKWLKTTLLLVDHLTVKIFPFGNVFLLWLYILGYFVTHARFHGIWSTSVWSPFQ